MGQAALGKGQQGRLDLVAAVATGAAAAELVGQAAISREVKESEPLAPLQLSWLEKLVASIGGVGAEEAQEFIDRVDNLDNEQRRRFITNLMDEYQTQSIPRLSYANKAKRADQVLALFEGMSYADIAAEFDNSQTAISQGVRKVAESIGKQTTLQDVATLIPQEADIPAEEAARPGKAEPA